MSNYKKIIEHYGISSQLKHFQSEVFELSEAIIQMGYPTIGAIGHKPQCLIDIEKKHIAEEIADCLVMIRQFKEYYDIPNDEIKNVMRYKVKRQLERIKNEKGE